MKPYCRREDLPELDLLDNARPHNPGWELIEPGQEPPSGAVRADRVHEEGGTAVQEIAFAISEGLEKAASDFVFAIGSNYLEEIAKLRAARRLWAQVAPGSSMRIHARTALSNKTATDPHMNQVRATTEALAAVIGGCDSLQVQPVGFSDRLAVNIQHILREESYLAR